MIAGHAWATLPEVRRAVTVTNGRIEHASCENASAG